MNTARLYHLYLAQTALVKAMDRSGVKPFFEMEIRVEPPTEYGQRLVEAVLSGENEEPKYITDVYGKVDIGWSFYSQFSYSSKTEQREQEIKSFLREMPGRSLVLMHNGRAEIVGEIHGVTYNISAGEAFCERVEVGTEIVQQPDPNAPTIEVEVPIMEWRCTDTVI